MAKIILAPDVDNWSIDQMVGALMQGVGEIETAAHAAQVPCTSCPGAQMLKALTTDMNLTAAIRGAAIMITMMEPGSEDREMCEHWLAHLASIQRERMTKVGDEPLIVPSTYSPEKIF